MGCGNWDELKAVFHTSPLLRFDWFVRSRTTQELSRRCESDTLIRLVEKENQEYDERERQERKEKKFPKSMTRTKRGEHCKPANEILSSLRKRRQSPWMTI